MTRYSRILSANFDAVELTLPVSLEITRKAEVSSRAGQKDRFATSCQLLPSVVTVRLTTRDLAAAEPLALGRSGLLQCTIAADRPDRPQRIIRVADAVLRSAETRYCQSEMAMAVLEFTAEAIDGEVAPFSSEATQ